MNKEKLLQASDWAEKNIKPEMFDMELYRNGGSYEPECDTVGCIVGHLTAIDAENVMKNYIDTHINFYYWSIDFFELNYTEWHYLFASEWSRVDNTLEGAIARMRRFANGMTVKEIKLELNKIGL